MRTARGTDGPAEAPAGDLVARISSHAAHRGQPPSPRERPVASPPERVGELRRVDPRAPSQDLSELIRAGARRHVDPLVAQEVDELAPARGGNPAGIPRQVSAPAQSELGEHEEESSSKSSQHEEQRQARTALLVLRRAGAALRRLTRIRVRRQRLPPERAELEAKQVPSRHRARREHFDCSGRVEPRRGRRVRPAERPPSRRRDRTGASRSR